MWFTTGTMCEDCGGPGKQRYVQDPVLCERCHRERLLAKLAGNEKRQEEANGQANR